MTIITNFSGRYAFLSNFYRINMIFEGKIYWTSEHAYQAAKMFSEKDAEYIRLLEYPGLAKKQARFRRAKDNWEVIKTDVMLRVLRTKFSIPTMRSCLIGTEQRTLVEGNTWGDTFWGVCNGAGENNLGKLLMQVREELRQ